VYASRTHSQLAQVVSELKATAYRPRMTVLGSREQLCVHPKISKLRGGVQNHACNTTNNTRSCSAKNNLDHYTGGAEGANGFPAPVRDIEELVDQVGRIDRVCPYFYSRDISKTADLVLLPYNYLLDSSIRRTLGIEWANSVVIFDEAHNLEKVACDASSFTLTSTELAECIREMQLVLKALADPAMAAQLQDSSFAPQGGEKLRPTPQMAMSLVKALFELERRVDEVPLESGSR
jgi:regulator of telomere elongation helicase 1